MSNRDTHFARFAMMLMDEILNVKGMYTNPNWRIDCQEVIARRAYDLVKHTIEQTEHINLDRLGPDEHVERIPDMTELPKEQEPSTSIVWNAANLPCGTTVKIIRGDTVVSTSNKIEIKDESENV
jgi:hypothetical protein